MSTLYLLTCIICVRAMCLLKQNLSNILIHSATTPWNRKRSRRFQVPLPGNTQKIHFNDSEKLEKIKIRQIKITTIIIHNFTAGLVNKIKTRATSVYLYALSLPVNISNYLKSMTKIVFLLLELTCLLSQFLLTK